MHVLSKKINGIPRLCVFVLLICFGIIFTIYIVERNKEHSSVSVLSRTCAVEVTTNYQYTHSGACIGNWSAWYQDTDNTEQRIIHGFQEVIDMSYTAHNIEYKPKGTCAGPETRLIRGPIRENQKGVSQTGVAYPCIQTETRALSRKTPTTRIGCTDPQSINYDARATSDDGSCMICQMGEIWDEGDVCRRTCPENYNLNGQGVCELDD